MLLYVIFVIIKYYNVMLWQHFVCHSSHANKVFLIELESERERERERERNKTLSAYTVMVSIQMLALTYVSHEYICISI